MRILSVVFLPFEKLGMLFLERFFWCRFVKKPNFFIRSHISNGVGCKGFLFQSVLYILLDQHINDREARYADKHTDEAEKTGHDRDGNDDPNGGQTRGGAVNTGNDNVTVDLLNHEYHDAEDDGIGRFTYEQDQRTGNGTDKGTEDRDDIGDADDDADQRCIGHTCDLNEQETNETDQHRVEDGCDEIFAEGSVCQRQEIRDFIVELFAAEGFHDFFCLCNNVFLRTEEISREYKAEHDVKKYGGYGLQNVLQHRQILLQQRIGVCYEIVCVSHCRVYDSRDQTVALCKIFDQCFQRSDIIRKFLDQVQDAGSQLRNDHRNEESQKNDNG